MFSDRFAFSEVRSDFVSRLYCIAYTLTANVSDAAGAAMLKLPIGQTANWPHVDDFDIAPLGFEGLLKSLYRFVSYGEQSRDYGGPDDFDKDFGRLQTIRQLSDVPAVQSTGAWLENQHGVVTGGRALAALLDVAAARLTLDEGTPLTIDQVALLAEVDVRTARNAMYLDGPARLNGIKQPSGDFQIRAVEALRWLVRRATFAQTIWVGSVNDATADPRTLAPSAVLGYLRSCIDARYPDAPSPGEILRLARNPADAKPAPEPGTGLNRLAAALKWPIEKIRQVVDGNLASVDTEDIHQLAHCLRIDGTWLVEQIARVTTASASAAEQARINGDAHVELTKFDAQNNEITVMLTEAGINNGYIDVEMRFAERFFPSDCFGGRAGDALGQTIDLIYDGKKTATDLRVKSKAFASPRKRFNGWFRKVGARVGDRVTIRLIALRTYTLSFERQDAAIAEEATQ